MATGPIQWLWNMYLKISLRNLPLVSGLLLVAALFIITAENSFFWDTIQLGSKHAAFYFNSNFEYLLLPDSIDSGHIPAFGMYIAFIWKIAGRSLLISHLAMLPFILGILWQLNILIKKFIPEKFAGLAFLLVLLDPTLLSQITLVSPDVPLVFFFLSAWNSILENKRLVLSLSVLCLFLTSMRGVMVSCCLLFLDIWQNISFARDAKSMITSFLRRSLIYLPAFIILVAFSAYHYHEKGWIGFHEDSPWAGSFERVGFTGMVYNLGILTWRILDFGRIGIWIVFFFLVLKFRRLLLYRSDTHLLIVFFLVLLLFLPLNMIWAENLLGHRYLLPVFLAFALLCSNILFSYELNRSLRSAMVFLWLAVLITGNLWVYPEKISQGWDATLGHLPYYKLRQEAIQYVGKQQIEFSNVQSFFPNVSTIDEADLNHDYRQFSHFNNNRDYVLYSNVFNVSDEEYDTIMRDYVLVKKFKKGMIYFGLYRKKG